MKLLKYLNLRKNRNLLIGINAGMAVGLALLSVVVDEKYGAAGLTTIYIMQVVCILNCLIAFVLTIWNIARTSKRKFAEREEKRNRLK